jgi:hypothetical protein
MGVSRPVAIRAAQRDPHRPVAIRAVPPPKVQPFPTTPPVPTVEAQMSSLAAFGATALPHAITNCVGDIAENPNVSPGHTEGAPNPCDACTGADSQPALTE